jgi:hypothetical protein
MGFTPFTPRTSHTRETPLTNGSRPKHPSHPFHPEEAQLRALYEQAYELKEQRSPYYVDALQAICDWHERRHLRCYERQQEDAAQQALALLAETDDVISGSSPAVKALCGGSRVKLPAGNEHVIARGSLTDPHARFSGSP